MPLAGNSRERHQSVKGHGFVCRQGTCMARIVSLGWMVAALAFAAGAQADEPDARALGMTEAILSYCAKVDPAAAEKYQQRLQLLSQDASEEALRTLRQSDEYRLGQDSMDESLARVDAQNARKACAGSLTEGQ